MRKKIKILFITLLSLLCFTCFSFGCAKLNNSSNADALFKNFKDEEIIVALGENYRLELAPLSDDTLYYEITASVADSQGKAVKTTNGSFTIADVNGYVITYKATSFGDVRNRKVRLTVKNERKPNVALSDCDTTYEVGETFTFPTITVYDLAGEKITPTATVYKIEGETQTEQSLATENTFLCESAGTYIFKATATNSFNVTGENELKFYVSALQVGEVESFNNPGSKNDVEVNSKYTEGFEWIEKTDATMGEREGVLKIDVNKTNQQRNIVTVYPKQAYENYLEKISDDEYKNKKFVVTMYVAAPVGSIPEMYAHFTSYRIKDIKYNMWYDYSFDAKTMLESYQAILDAEEKDLQNLYNNALSLWGTFRTEATLYIDRIAFAETEIATSVAEDKSYVEGREISLTTEMPVEGYDNVEYTVLLEGKPVAVTSDKFTPEYVSDNYTVIASVKGEINELNDNAEFCFKVTAENGYTARLNNYTATVNVGDEVTEPTIEIYDGSSKVEGFKVTTHREFVSNAGMRSEASSFTMAKSGTFEYTLTAEKDGLKFIETASVRVGPFEKDEVISMTRADVLELFGTTKGTLLTKDDLNSLKTNFAGISDTAFEKVVRFTKNNSDKSFELNFKPVHTLEYYKDMANVKPTVSITMYLASANEKITEFSVEMFQDKENPYIVKANTWTTIEVPISVMIKAMEDNRLYPLNTWTHCAIKIKPNSTAEDHSIANSECNLFLGDITLIGDESGDNYVQDW